MATRTVSNNGPARAAATRPEESLGHDLSSEGHSNEHSVLQHPVAVLESAGGIAQALAARPLVEEKDTAENGLLFKWDTFSRHQHKLGAHPGVGRA